jgi:hypothetical protein
MTPAADSEPLKMEMPLTAFSVDALYQIFNNNNNKSVIRGNEHVC